MIYKIEEVSLFKKIYTNSKTKKDFVVLKAFVDGRYYTVREDNNECDRQLPNESEMPITLVNVKAHLACKEKDGYKNYTMYVMDYEDTKAYVEPEADIKAAFGGKPSVKDNEEEKLPF